MTATRRTASVLFAVAAGAFAPVIHAGSSLNVVLTVTYSSGPCGAAVTRESVSVFCGPIPLLAGGAALSGQAALTRIFTHRTPPFLAAPGATTGTLGPSDARSEPGSPDTEHALRQIGVLPASVTGDTPLAVYSGGANVSSWRVVSIDNAEHVELTISW